MRHQTGTDSGDISPEFAACWRLVGFSSTEERPVLNICSLLTFRMEKVDVMMMKGTEVRAFHRTLKSR